MHRSVFACSLTAALLLLGAAAQAQDSDSDGVADANDRFPCDSARAGLAFAPAEGVYGTLMFEDHWPLANDRDLNDAVIAYNAVYELDANGQTVGLQLILHPLALGGDFDNGLGLQLAVPASQVASVTRSVGAVSQTLAPSNLDANFTVDLSPNLRELFGGAAGPINVRADLAQQAGSTLVVNVAFTGPVNVAASAAPHDLFLFRANDRKLEIHGTSFAGTAQMDASLFNTGDDGSTTSRRFVDSQGVPFLIVLPELAGHTTEFTNISARFPAILEFAASGGTARQDFYKVQVNAAAGYVDVNGQGVPAPSSPVSPTADVSCVNPFLGHHLLDMPFDTDRANHGSWSVSVGANVVATTSGGIGDTGHGAGFSNSTHCIDIPDQHVGGTGSQTYATWYRGTQTNSSGHPYQTGVLIFGDPNNSVWLGLGVDQGKIAIANGGFARGSTHVADGQWHHLAWVRVNQQWSLYVDGALELTHGAGGSPPNQYIRTVGCGYPYPGTASPTALDSIQVFDFALSSDEVLHLFDPTAPLPSCFDGVQNGAERGIDCGGACQMCPAVAILDVDFDGAVSPQGSLPTNVGSGVSATSNGGVLDSGYGTGFANTTAGRLDITDLHVGGGGENTFSVWYRGTQTNSSAHPYQTGVLIFGDPAGSVWIGAGIDQGKICIANSYKRHGTTNVADGQWHHLAFTRVGNLWQAYVDGNLEIANYSATGNPGTQYFRVIGGGYPYAGTASPTQLDELLIYDVAFQSGGIQALANP